MHQSLKNLMRRRSDRLANKWSTNSRLGMEKLEDRHLLAGDIVISEFMSANNDTLNDEDGDSPDWIEVFNNGSTAVDLEGWHLTDDAMELTKWTFPAVTLEPDAYMLVFASDKDRTDPNSELHANFRLTSGGEYLAIVEADGTTISHDYNPSYPEQLADISYGLEQSTVETGFVVDGAEASVLIPTSAGQDVAAATWTASGFDDGAWATHDMGVGFDAGGELVGEISANGNIAAEMQGNTASAYVRTEFDLGAVPALDQLFLDVNYDDGFVAYLNGVEVANRNAPAVRNWSSQATQNHGGDLASVNFDSFNDEDLQALFQLNGRANFSGDRLRITAPAASSTGSAFLAEPLPFGSDYSFSAQFTLDVNSPGNISVLEQPDSDGPGGQGMTFVVQSGDQFRLGGGGGGLGLTNTGAPFVAVEFDTFETGAFDEGDVLPSHIGINTSADGSVARVAVNRFNGAAAGVNMRYTWVEYDGFTKDLDVYFSETNAKPADPTLTANVDFDSIFSGTPELWTGFTASTSFNWNSHDVVDFNMATFSSELGLTTETIEISQHIGELQAGTNVLAIHGLNLNASDDDFLVDATLAGALNNVTVLDPAAYFVLPTPGEPNGEGSERPAGNVEFSVDSQTFTDAFSLTITAEEPGATIRYTTDGAIPTEASSVYGGPIQISESSQIRARAFEDGLAPGRTFTKSYVQMDPSVSNFEGSVFESNLPIIVLDSFGDAAADSDGTNFHSVSMMVFEPENGVASLANAPDLSVRGGLRRRGQSSQGWPKGQYAMEVWDETIDYQGAITGKRGPDLAVSLLGMPSESDWVIQGPYADKTQLNNYVAFNLYRELGLTAPRIEFAEVFLNRGGTVDMATDYRGTYIIMEKIKIDNDRVDVKPAILDPVIGQDPSTVGGYIFKQDKAGARDVNFSTTGHGGTAIPLKFHDPDAPNAAQQAYMTWFVNEFEAALYSEDWTDPELGYAKYIDVDSWIDHWLVTEMAKEIDGYRISEYFFLNDEGKIEKGPGWDFNLSFSNANYLQGGIWEGFYMPLISGAQPHWYPRLFQDPAFESRLQDRWFELREDAFSQNNIFGLIDDGVEALTNGSPDYDTPPVGESNPISRNYTRWGFIDDYLWPNCFFAEGGECRANPLPPGAGKPTENNAPDSYDDYIFIMKDFVENRLAWIDEEFGRPPAFNPRGGIVTDGTQLTLTTDHVGDTIYYTTDGSDPRQPQIVETEFSVAPDGASGQLVVPTSDTMINACVGIGISLPNAQNCFMSPNYTLGQHGETWTDVSGGIGYDSGDGAFSGLIDSDVGGLMENTNGSAYVRLQFDLTPEQLARASEWNLKINYDDGFVFYSWFGALNIPRELYRRNAPGTTSTFPIRPLAIDATAPTDRSDADALQSETITIARGNLVAGTNYFGLQLLNSDAASDDLLLNVDLTYTEESIVLPDTVIEYVGPITLDRNMIVSARSYDDVEDKWSSRSSQAYFVDVPPIVVTELNYNPVDPTMAEYAVLYAGPDGAVGTDDDLTPDNDDFEFLEIMNQGSEAFDLTGMTIVEGVNFVFESGSLNPGERGVLVRNQEAFELRYGNGVNVLGSWGDPLNPAGADKLNNDGERILIQGPLGEPTMDFEYNDAWYPLTDGNGYSLVIADPNADPGTWGDAASWRPSDFQNGSPGTADNGIAPLQGSVIINELLANSSTGDDAIELFNTTSSPVDIGNFYLTDDPDNMTKFRVAVGTMVPANGYLVLDSELGAGFDLSNSGGRVVLQAATAAGVFTGFQETRRFDAADPDVTEGRYLAYTYTDNAGNVVDNIDFVTLSSPTLGSVNAGPTIGPVVINEIMYNPGLGGTEWVELKNISSGAIDLGSTPWVVAEGLDYTFPEGTSVPAGGTALLIQGPDESDHSAVAGSFRTANNVPANVPIYVYEPLLNGSLDNAGEDLSIGRSTGVGLPAILTELIEYNNSHPWPTEPAGAGPSLARITGTSYGNDPANWSVGGVGGTPGRDNSFQDLSPPTVPTDVHGSLESETELVIAWRGSVDAESGVDHYNIYKGNVIVGTSVIPRFVDSAQFTSADPISYQVSAVNTDGKESDLSVSSAVFEALSLDFQEGVGGYTGGTDLEIRSGTNFSAVGIINVDGDDSGKTFGLVKWDNLTSIPEGAVIAGIEIKVTVVDNAYSTYQVERLNQSWDEATASWDERTTGVPWGGPGATGPTDTAGIVGEVPGSSNGTTIMNADAITMVQEWIADPSTNHGVIFNEPAAGGTDGLDFYSKENTLGPENNPRLTILYIQPPQASDLGDLDVDGVLDVDDINLLLQAINYGLTDSAFDINNSGSVDSDDVGAWLELVGTVPGDSDLDGDVDVADLNNVGLNWQSNLGVGWGEGDFDGSGKVDSVDLNAVGLNWQHGVAALAARVPRAPLAGGVDVVDQALVHEFVGATRALSRGSVRDAQATAKFDSTSDTFDGLRGRRARKSYSDIAARRTGDDANTDKVETRFSKLADDILANWNR